MSKKFEKLTKNNNFVRRDEVKTLIQKEILRFSFNLSKMIFLKYSSGSEGRVPIASGSHRIL